MPELPEVETVRIQLLAKVVEKTIATVTVFHAKTVNFDDHFSSRITGKTIEHIDRIGKLLIFSFKDNPDFFLLAHLKMTGQFLFRDKRGKIAGGGHTLSSSDTTVLPGRHTRLALAFTDGSVLYFNDMRLFGYVKAATKAEVDQARAGFGPEPIAPDFNATWFAKTIRSRRAPVKAVLIDQSFVAGLGNIYVDEALWRAHVRPTRRADRLTVAEATLLAQTARAVLQESIVVGGTTFQHFVDTGGEAGNFIDYLKVFGKQNKPCERCGTTIKKVRTAGRGTHFCPGCQH